MRQSGRNAAALATRDRGARRPRRGIVARSEAIWREARPADDFAAALPGLEEMLNLTRQVADAKAEALATSPYEALLDQYEPGGSTALIDRLFDEPAGFLPDLLDEVLARQAA